MLRWASTCDFGLGSAVYEILLGQFHEEVSVQLDVEVEIGRRGLGLLDVQVERRVKQADRLNLVAFLPPFKLGLKEGMLGAFALRLADLKQKL